MTEIASVDYVLKRIHLHLDTVTSGFDCIAGYFELNQRSYDNLNNEQNYAPIMSAEGNISKGSGNFTPRYGLLNPGWRYVPYAGVNHTLGLITEPVSLDGESGRNVFDRSTLVSSGITVEIDELYEKIEIREVNTGSGVTDLDKSDIINGFINSAQFQELYIVNDLHPSKPNTYNDDGSAVTNSDFTQDKTDNGNGTFTIQRS